MLASLPLQAAFFGGLAGSALLLGAAIGYFVKLPKVVSASVMAFGIGVLIAALTFNLMQEALVKGGVGVAPTASLAIAIGSLLDGVPESAAIGISLLDSEGVALITLIAIFISNVPEGLSSAIGMKRAGKPASYVFGIWGAIALACSLSAVLGYLVIGSLGPFYIGIAIATAAGAIFVMLIDTMIPEAFEDMHNWSGPIAAAGFLFAFALSNIF